MKPTAHQCRCGQPIADDATLCAQCSDLLRKLLDKVDGLAEDLETTRTRQTRIGGSGTSSGDGSLAWDERASVAAAALRSTVATLVTEVEPSVGRACGSSSVSVMSAYLRRHREHLRHHPDADRFLDTLHSAIRSGMRAIDRAPTRRYLGRCGASTVLIEPGDVLTIGVCRHELFATDLQNVITCGECEQEHDVEARRQTMNEQLEDQLLTAHELTMLSSVERPITSGTIRQWIARGRLVPRSTRTTLGPDGEQQSLPLFLVADVRTAQAADHEVSTKRRDEAARPCPTVHEGQRCSNPVGLTKSGKPAKTCASCRERAARRGAVA